MPVQYVGNSITKAAEPDGSGGYRSAIEAQSGGGTPGETIYDVPWPTDSLQTVTLLEDGFESGDHSSSGYPDFEWRVGGGDSGSIVTQVGDSGYVIQTSGGSPANTEVAGVDWTAFEGDNSLRISYVDAESYQDPEQYWELLNNTGVDEMVVGFMLKVPDNYRHTTATDPSNYKLFAIFMDGYSGAGTGATVIWEYWNDGDNPGSSRVAWHANKGDQPQADGHKDHTPFISYPDDQGRWMEIIFRVKKSSAFDVADGQIEMLRRWEDEDQFTQIHSSNSVILNSPAPATGITGWRKGYLLGAVNGIGTTDGERLNFLIDRVKMQEIV